MREKQPSRRLILWIVALVTVVLGVAGSLWRVGASRGWFAAGSRTATGRAGGAAGVSTSDRPAGSSLAGGGTVRERAADIPVGLLMDYYEHAVEHTPPRDPTGCMQRRERNYTAPPNPFTLVRSRLTASPADVAFRQQFDAWETRWRQGTLQATSPGTARATRQRGSSNGPDLAALAILEKLAIESSLNAVTLLDAGRAIDFLAGDEAAAAWYRAGLAKAQVEYQGTSPGDPKARPLLAVLDQTKALWRINDRRTMEKRFALARALNAPLSPESRRAGCLLAQMLFYQGRGSDAADVMLGLWKEHAQAGDLGALERSDFGEMYWETGLFLYVARRWDEAVPQLEGLLKTDDGRKRQACQYILECLVESDRYDEARARVKQYAEQYSLPAAQADQVEQRIEMRQRRKAATRPVTVGAGRSIDRAS